MSEDAIQMAKWIRRAIEVGDIEIAIRPYDDMANNVKNKLLSSINQFTRAEAANDSKEVLAKALDVRQEYQWLSAKNYVNQTNGLLGKLERAEQEKRDLKKQLDDTQKKLRDCQDLNVSRENEIQQLRNRPFTLGSAEGTVDEQDE